MPEGLFVVPSSKLLITPGRTGPPAAAELGDGEGTRFKETPPFQTPLIARVAVMSAVGSPATSSKSARRPTAIVPRSASENTRAGVLVAAASASVGVSPAST